jgi:hypothetical protein
LTRLIRPAPCRALQNSPCIREMPPPATANMGRIGGRLKRIAAA